MGLIGYFSAEIGLESDLPTYSGGLGVLAGDHVKSAADAEIDLVAVTLLYRKGYCLQKLDQLGNQIDQSVSYEPSDFLENTNRSFSMQIHNESVHVDIWKKEIIGSTGHYVPVYFLDTNHPSNSQAMKDLTGHLYGGDDRNRVCQEILLGVGGVRTFELMEHKITGMHLNEGHCTFALLEKAKSWGREEVRKRTLFTTHTPVPAGHDRFEWDLVEELLGALLPTDAKQMVKDAGDEEEGKRCSMSHLGIALSGQVNAVSSLNAEVASAMFPKNRIHPITNGVHHITWTSTPFQVLFDESAPGWRQNPLLLKNSQFSDEQLLKTKENARMQLHQHVFEQTGVTFEPHRLTIGFARRFATYKRANLVFSDLEALQKIGSGKIQFVFSGKAHPKDMGGKALIKDIFKSSKSISQGIPVAFLEDYSMDTGLLMTSGVDIWLNNPTRPMEASGTSGMKAAMNGTPNCSILDGWWPEACIHGVNGWAIGKGESDRDDTRDAAYLLSLLKDEIIPAWENKSEVWPNIMRESISASTGFTGVRMIEDYANFYSQIND